MPQFGRDQIAAWNVAAKRAEAEILRIARHREPGVLMQGINAMATFGPSGLAFWVTTPTDEQRDRPAEDRGFEAECREAMAAAGFAPDEVRPIGLTFQSQETVDRDYEGSWFYAMR